MPTRATFGFESRGAQASYPLLIGAMLLVNRHVFPTFPVLKTVDFILSIVLIATYAVCRNALGNVSKKRTRQRIRFLEKLIEVYIGVSVLSSILYTALASFFD